MYGSGKLGIYYEATDQTVYELTDHLGNVRAVINRNKKADGSIEVMTSTDYYVMGLEFRKAGTAYRYGYQGQYSEKDGETGYNAFELRMYDGTKRFNGSLLTH